MSVDPADDAATRSDGRTCRRFRVRQVGPSASTHSSEKEFVRRLARFRRTQRTGRRLTVGVADRDRRSSSAGWLAPDSGSEAPAAAVLSYRVDNQDPPSGGYILAPQTAESLLAFSDGSKVRLAARARGRVVEVSSRGARFALDAGKVSVDIVQRPRAQWIFEAGPFRVNVHGTSFTIAWNPVDAVFEVRLISGAISVASPVAGPEIQMRAGQTLRVSLRDQSSTMGDDERRARVPVADRRALPHPLRSSRPGLRPAGPAGAAALVAPRLDGRALGKQGGRHRRRRRSPRSDVGARARRQRGPLGAGQCRPICGPACAGRPSSERPSTGAFRRRIGRGKRPSCWAACTTGIQIRLKPSDGTIAISSKRTMAWVSADALGRKMTLLERSNRRAEALAVAREYLRRSPRGTYANAARALVRSSTTGP